MTKKFGFDLSGRRSMQADRAYGSPGWATQNYYLDPVSGNDDNDGRSAGSPIQTFDHYWNNILPDVVMQSHTLTMAEGVVSVSGTYAQKQLLGTASLRFQGDTTGFDFTGSGGPLSVSSGSSGVMTFSPSPGWVTNTHAGRMIYNHTKGYMAYVFRNTADTLYLYYGYSVSASDSVEWCKFKTSIDGYWDIRVIGGDPGLNAVRFNDLNLTGFSKTFFGDVEFRFDYVCSEQNLAVWGTAMGWRMPAFDFYDSCVKGRLLVQSCIFDAEYPCVTGGLQLYGCDLQSYYMDGKFLGSGYDPAIKLYRCDCLEEDGFGDIEVDPNGNDIAIDIKNCPLVRLYRDLNITNPGANGIRVQNSQLVVSHNGLSGAPTSYGVILRHGSRLRLKSFVIPTLNGGTADIYDGSGTSTWAAVQGGTPLVNTNEMTSAVLDTIALEDE